MCNKSTATDGAYAWFGSGTMVVSAVGVAFVVALWFTSMLFFVRGFVGATSTQAMMAEPACETVVQ